MKYSNNVEIYELKSDLKGKAYYYKDSQTLTIHFEERHEIYEDYCHLFKCITCSI